MNKTKCKKILAAMLCLTLCFSLIPFNGLKAYAICCRKNGFDKSKYTLTGNMAEDVATIAKSQKGRTCEQFGYSGVDYGLWCDEFVADCLENAGADSSIVGHGGTVSDFRSVMINKGAKVVTSPQTGDLVFFTNGSRLSHVEIVTKVSNGVVYCAGGNNGSWPGVCQGEHIAKNQGTISSYLRPNYPNSKHTVIIHYNANGGAVASDSNYKIGTNNDLYRKSDNKLMGPTWEAGYKDPNGLVNASTLKMTRIGYTFKGWSLSKDGSTKVWDQNDANVSANDLYPNITKQNGTVMLYAIWEKNKLELHYNANGGTLASDSDFYLDSSSNILKKSDKKGNLNNWDIDTRTDYGLYNASTMKLTRDGCKFLGWSLSKNSGTIYDQNDATVTAETFFPDIKTKSGSVTFYAQWGGYEMKESEGAGQTIPDGDYWITNGLSSGYLVDIPGTNFDTTNGTNLQMWQNNWTDYDVFTVTYLNNGFYRITQRTTNQAIEVAGGSLRHGTNVQTYNNRVSNPNGQWSIRKTDNGYTLQARCNALYLDVSSSKVANGQNLCMWEGTNDDRARSFSFIPYNVGQTIEDGVYRIGTACGEGVYLDAAGEPGEYQNETNVQIWDAGADNYFRFEYQNDGFYKIYDNESGLALDVYNPSKTDYLGKGTNVQLYTSKDTLGQYWAIKPAENGYYYIISKLNGYYLNLDKGTITNGTNILTWFGTSENEEWSLVTNKELIVTPPTKTEYIIGEQLDTTGMSVKMEYSDGYKWDVTNKVSINYDFSTVGTKTVTVTYENGGFVNTATFDVNVNEAETTTVETTTEYTTTTTTQSETIPKDSTTTDVITTEQLDETTTSVTVTTTSTQATSQETTTVERIAGDINCDGIFNVSDVVLIQKWLLAVPDTNLADWKAGDLCEDGKLDVFDLCLMKRLLINGSISLSAH